jgi:hypothetical protein
VKFVVDAQLPPALARIAPKLRQNRFKYSATDEAALDLELGRAGNMAFAMLALRSRAIPAFIFRHGWTDLRHKAV